MQRFSITLVVFSLFAYGSTTDSYADGLIKNLPAPGKWSSFDVSTTISHQDGSRTNSTGTLIVRSLGQTTIDGKTCRWLEFEHSWEQEPTDKNPQRFHSSIQNIAIDESVFVKNTDPTKGILAGTGAKTSADEQPEKWIYKRVHALKPGLGSTSGFGALDYYIRSPLDRPTEIGHQQIDVGDISLRCIGIEHSDTTHKIGANKNSVTTTAYRQWASDDTHFGVVDYHFERLRMDGTSFSQQLTLKASGENAKTSLPDSK